MLDNIYPIKDTRTWFGVMIYNGYSRTIRTEMEGDVLIKDGDTSLSDQYFWCPPGCQAVSVILFLCLTPAWGRRRG